MSGPSEPGFLGDKFDGFEGMPDDSVWERIHSKLPSAQRSALPALSGLAVEPPSQVWNGIEAALHPHRKVYPLAWMPYAAAACIMLLLGLPTAQLLVPPTGTSAQLSKSSQQPVLQESDTINKSKTEFLAENVAGNSNQVGVTKEDRPILPGKEETGFTSISSGIENASANDLASTSSAYRQASQLTSLASLSPQAIKTTEPKLNDTGAPLVRANEKPSREPAQMQLFAGNTSGSTSSTSSDLAMNEDAFNVATSADETQTHTSREEFLPALYFGIQGRLPITKRLHGSLGLGYLQINSNEEISGAYQIENRRYRREYLAIPLAIQWHFISRKKLNVYLAPGAVYEWALSGYGESEIPVGRDERFALDVKPGQLGISGSLGVNYRLIKRWGVFGEFTTTTYVTEAADSPWRQRNFWPSGRFGVSFNLK